MTSEEIKLLTDWSALLVASRTVNMTSKGNKNIFWLSMVDHWPAFLFLQNPWETVGMHGAVLRDTGCPDCNVPASPGWFISWCRACFARAVNLPIQGTYIQDGLSVRNSTLVVTKTAWLRNISLSGIGIITATMWKNGMITNVVCMKEDVHYWSWIAIAPLWLWVL